MGYKGKTMTISLYNIVPFFILLKISALKNVFTAYCTVLIQRHVQLRTY